MVLIDRAKYLTFASTLVGGRVQVIDEQGSTIETVNLDVAKQLLDGPAINTWSDYGRAILYKLDPKRAAAELLKLELKGE